MEFKKDVFIELLSELDKVKTQISRIQDKLCKISVASTESKPQTYVYKEKNNGIK